MDSLVIVLYHRKITLRKKAKNNKMKRIVKLFLLFSAISEEEKGEIKRGLLQCFREPFYPVALQLAVVVGKAARFIHTSFIDL